MFGAPLSQVSDFLERADNIEPDKDNVDLATEEHLNSFLTLRG